MTPYRTFRFRGQTLTWARDPVDDRLLPWALRPWRLLDAAGRAWATLEHGDFRVWLPFESDHPEALRGVWRPTLWVVGEDVPAAPVHLQTRGRPDQSNPRLVMHFTEQWLARLADEYVLFGATDRAA